MFVHFCLVHSLILTGVICKMQVLKVLASLVLMVVQTESSESYGTNCYPELGCFPVDYPWTSVLRPFFPPPSSPSEVGVKLYCYTRDSKRRHNITLWPEIKLDGCKFSPRRTSVFVTHGYIQNANLPWLSDIKNNYLKAADANVFLVDWGKGAGVPSYPQACSNTRIVGAEVARFIKFMETNHSMKTTHIHLIGHSLGAHVLSYTAKRVPWIGHFTALEPAQPGFEGTDSEVRLDKSDAYFVEVIHTNAAPTFPTLGFGMIAPHGDVDFYINGGSFQPGCPLPDNKHEIKDMKDLTPEIILYNMLFCSHNKCQEYYSRTLVENCMIWGRSASHLVQVVDAITSGVVESKMNLTEKCTPTTCIPMGLDTPYYKARGVFEATTLADPPYCETDPEVNRKLISEVSESSSEEYLIKPTFKEPREEL